ncbi:hypothetical protein FRB91_009151 [Serendipita sp. 411]|nr:hypothetical protein FRB91_009151 [Serendipita sp. 411]
MPTPEPDGAKQTKKPGIPRPSGIRQSLGHISKSSVSKVITEVMHGGSNNSNKENSKAKESRRLSALKPPSVVTLVKESKDNDSGSESKANVGSKLVKSPLVGNIVAVAKPTQPVAPATRTDTSTPSPKSNRKQTVLSTSSTTIPNSSSISTLRPRESVGTSLPKYKPKASLLPPKQLTLTRKRRSSIIEAEEEDSPDSPDDGAFKIAERPISPLPRRRSRVHSTVSISSKVFDPKITLTAATEKLPAKEGNVSTKTPPRTRASNSTSSSVRVRTVSTTTTSSRLSGKIMDSPVRRTEKRPRLSSSETKHVDSNKLGSSLLSMSTSTIGVDDISSDSIDVADVSALLSVSPNVSPSKSTAPSSVRRVAIRRAGIPTGNGSSPSPSRKAGISTLPSRQATAPTYLAPPPDQSSLRRPPARSANTKNRKSVLSWADFSKHEHLFKDDLGLISDMTPLKGIVPPGAEDHPLRERVDSGWGLDSPRLFGNRFNLKSPSIGQLMFPSANDVDNTAAGLGARPKGRPQSEVLANKLLNLKAAEAEREIEALKKQIKTLESQLRTESSTTSAGTGPVPFPSDDSLVGGGAESPISDTRVPIENELALQRLQNAELDAKAAFLEQSLSGALEQIAEKDGELEQMTEAMRQLETRFEQEKEGLEEEKRLASESAKTSVESAQRQVKEVKIRCEKSLKTAVVMHKTMDAWGLVRSIAQSDLENVKQLQLTLSVFKAGLEAVRSQPITP